jgi:predicted GNAT superfamily acetyltransferase
VTGAPGRKESTRLLISELHELEELRELEALLASVWGSGEAPPLNTDVLRALSHSGNYVVGARVERQLVGGLVGWLGGRPDLTLHMHSHILGVAMDSQVVGVGFELKQHQRRWCLERGVNVVEWTTDPLVRRNAYFNLSKLGAEAHDYLINFYGVMTDGINAGEESDRLLISWQLDSPQAEAAAEGHSLAPDVDQLLRDGAVALLLAGAAGEPVAGAASSPRVLICQVPEDIVALRRAAPPIARSWRLALRRVMSGAMKAGYRVTGATRTGWYVLKRQDPE